MLRHHIASHSFLGRTEIVDGRVQSHVSLHVHAFLQLRHDPLDADLEILPSKKR